MDISENTNKEKRKGKLWPLWHNYSYRMVSFLPPAVHLCSHGRIGPPGTAAPRAGVEGCRPREPGAVCNHQTRSAKVVPTFFFSKSRLM